MKCKDCGTEKISMNSYTYFLGLFYCPNCAAHDATYFPTGQVEQDIFGKAGV